MLSRPMLLLVAFLVLCAPRLAATWSIVLVDVRSGEIAVASATCLPGFDLAAGVPVVVVGHGVAAAQSRVDSTGRNRLLIRDQLLLGTDPAQILAMLDAQDPDHQTRQYGIVDVSGRAIGFTGSGAGAFAGDRVGRVGDIVYAIQGNVLTGGAVLAAAELALYTTSGDLGEKLMAAMEAAAAFGGDGRCSCAGSNPTSCGAPPPNFRKSADVAFMIVSRAGDVDGSCTAQAGCANGSYHLRLNVANQRRSDPDPVLTLRSRYEQWKLSQRGRPDHLLSSVEFAAPTLPDDGRSRTVMRIVLRDRTGARLSTGGANVQVIPDTTRRARVTAGTVFDNGDGSYSVRLTAGSNFGMAAVRVRVDDGSGPRELMPTPEIEIEHTALWVNREELPASTGGTLDFSMSAGTVVGRHRPWFLLASNSGTRPGLALNSFVRLMLNHDPLLQVTAVGAYHGVVPQLSGTLDAGGRAWTSLTFPRGIYGLPIGSEVSFAYVVGLPTPLFAAPPVDVRITF